jgi:hypothetical protein
MKETVSEPDRRTARSHRTRDAVIDALLALIREGDPKPGARHVADAVERR